MRFSKLFFLLTFFLTFLFIFSFSKVFAGGCQESCVVGEGCTCRGYRIDSSETLVINEHGLCYTVINAANSPSTFIPTKTQTEWNFFCSYRPSHITLTPCPPRVSCTAISSSQINVSWTDVAGEEGYRIYRCSGSGCTPTTLVQTVGANVTSWSNTGLSQNTTYGYRVKAYNSNGESAWSNTAYCTTLASTPAPVAYPKLMNNGRGWHTCAILENRTAKCWGSNEFGQLGDGTTVNRPTPVSVSGLTNVISIAAGGNHTCALLNDGTVKCWGYNQHGQLGDGTTIERHTPVSVSGLTNVISITAGTFHTCALLKNGTVKCWGYNNVGQLGDGTTIEKHTPVSVSGLTNVISIAAGGDHTCALLNNGAVYCWGANYYGQLGNGYIYAYESTPLFSVLGLTNVTSITAGSIHTCALLNNGAVYCWGANDYGQLGDGTTVNRPYAVPVSGLTNAISIAAGSIHTCALLNNGTAKCWGGNIDGQLGNGTTNNSSIPVSVSGLTNAVSITAGMLHTCARLNDGTIKCWGWNGRGQLGDGTYESRSTPVSVKF